MYVSFVDSYVDYANDELSSRNVICLDSLGDRISDLLMLYINNDMRPEFRFLPLLMLATMLKTRLEALLATWIN